MMTSGFINRCKSVKLTKSEKAMADYVVAHYREACFLTCTELAENVGSSHSSVVRFTKDLGFSGYTEFQDYLRSQYEEYLAGHAEAPTLPVEKLNLSLSQLSRDDLAQALFEKTRGNLQQALVSNSPDTLKAAARAVVKARSKYIVGYRGCASTASFLYIMLHDTVPHVHSADSTTLSAADFLADIGSEDVLLAVGFPRYNKQTLCAVKQAKKAGAAVIALTDKITSPLAENADHILLAPVDSLVFFNSQTPAMFIAELLCTYVCKEVGKGNEERLQTINEFVSMTELY